MNKKETKEWFDGLKDGDFVFIGYGGGHKRVHQVERRTKARVYVNSRAYHVDSWGFIREYGSTTPTSTWIEPATEDARALALNRERVGSRLYTTFDKRHELLQRIQTLDVPELDRLCELLEDVNNILAGK